MPLVVENDQNLIKNIHAHPIFNPEKKAYTPFWILLIFIE